MLPLASRAHRQLYKRGRWRLEALSVTCKTAQPKRQHPSSMILLDRARFPVCRYGIDRAAKKWESKQKCSSALTYLTGVTVRRASSIGHDACLFLVCRREVWLETFFFWRGLSVAQLWRAPVMRAAAEQERSNF